MAEFIKVSKLISILFFAIEFCAAAPERVQPLIISGVPVRIQDAPYYAGLIDCGGVILSESWVLTAAHCVEHPMPPPYKYVWVGGETFANSEQVPYSEVIIHEGFKRDILGIVLHDIALLKLAKPLRFTKKVQPIKLPVGQNKNRRLTVVGRGKDETGKVSEYLKKMDLIGLSTNECASLIPNIFDPIVKPNLKLFDQMNVCAKKEADKPSICNGDSGGPLVSKDSLVGLVSYIGNQRCDEARLGFYVNVTTYVPWIRKHTGL